MRVSRLANESHSRLSDLDIEPRTHLVRAGRKCDLRARHLELWPAFGQGRGVEGLPYPGGAVCLGARK